MIALFLANPAAAFPAVFGRIEDEEHRACLMEFYGSPYPPANADPNCEPWDKVVKTLASRAQYECGRATASSSLTSRAQTCWASYVAPLRGLARIYREQVKGGEPATEVSRALTSIARRGRKGYEQELQRRSEAAQAEEDRKQRELAAQQEEQRIASERLQSLQEDLVRKRNAASQRARLAVQESELPALEASCKAHQERSGHACHPACRSLDQGGDCTFLEYAAPAQASH